MDGWPADDLASSSGRPAVLGQAAAELAELTAIGAAHFRAGRHAAAVEAFQQVLLGCRVRLGADHVGTLTVAGNLAVARIAAGQRRPGISELEANVAERIRVLGDTDPRTLTARDALATAYRLAGDVDDALALAKQVTAQRMRSFGPADPDTLISRMGLIRAVAAAGDISTAVDMLNSALRDAEAAHGPHHWTTRGLLQCGEHSGILHRGR